MIALLDNTPLHLVRLNVDQYHKMLTEGILEEGAPIELLDGLLVYKDRRSSRDVPVTTEPHVYVEVEGCELPIVSLSVDQYHGMLRAGILEEGSPIELIDGLLTWKDRSATGEDFMTVSPRHSATIKILLRILGRMLEGRGVHLMSQQPVALRAQQEPEPDICVIEGVEEDYVMHHPGPRDVALLIEVADSSLGGDRGRKCEAYAAAGIASYWIVNLLNDCVEVYSNVIVENRTYASLDVYHVEQAVPFTILGTNYALPVSSIFPPADTDI